MAGPATRVASCSANVLLPLPLLPMISVRLSGSSMSPKAFSVCALSLAGREVAQQSHSSHVAQDNLHQTAIAVCILLRWTATDGFNVVSVWIKHESAVVVGVIPEAKARGAIISATNR
jgi:hypothetical protein